MPRRWKSLLVSSLFSALLLASCDPGGAGLPGSPTAPRAAADLTLSDFTLVEAPPLSAAQQTARLIGPGGGVLELLGHTLSVPAGAVSQPTLFTMVQLPNGHIEVELTAIRITLFGVIDVGASGFLNDETVGVTLSYASATNVDDPSRLVVLYMRGDGGVEPVPTTVDETAETVTVELEHFSRYAMAID